MKTLEFGINPSRFIGFNYVKRMYALRKYPRPMIQIHMFFFVVWFKMPWVHVSDRKHSARVISWGFVFRIFPWYYHINRG